MWARVAILCLVAATPAYAVEVELQGVLHTAGGSPASGSFTMGFKLFAAETGGSALFTQTGAPVDVVGGVYDVTLASIPEGFFAQHPVLWLEATVGGQVLPRRPLRSVPTAESAKTATVAASAGALTCSSCVASGQVSFAYAGASSKGGAALDLDCTGCVGATELAAEAIGTTHLQNGAVTAQKAGFSYAGAATPGGAATDLACTGCVGSSDLAASLALAGDVTVSGGLHACTSGYSGCAVGVGTAALVDQGTGWLGVQATEGLRVRSAANSAWRKVEFGGGSSFGDLAITGNATVTGSVGVGTATPSAPLDVAGLARAGALRSATYVQLGPDATDCTSGKAGSLRWSGTLVEVCDGKSWHPVADLPPTGASPKQPARSCKDILQSGYSTGSGTYWLDPSNGFAAPFQVTCDMTTDGGGWTKLNANLASISVSKGTASWSGSDVVGTGHGTGCGVTPRQYTLTGVPFAYTEVYVLLTRTTSILQCSSIGGGSAGWYTPPWTGAFNPNGMCLWGDGIFAHACCNTSTSGLKLDWVMKKSGVNTELYYNTECASPDQGAFTMRWFVR
ncbi:MAG: hypothetical protein AMXMBFR64_14170 [Myxococcales bacterium]